MWYKKEKYRLELMKNQGLEAVWYLVGPWVSLRVVVV
jgi:hypothetical protein